VSVISALGSVSRAQQIEPGDAPAVSRVGVGLLFDSEPAGAEPLCPEPKPPAHRQLAANLADGSLDEFKVLGVAEPVRELACDHLGASPLPEARGSSAGTGRSH
jgi:hypothetical protein